MNVLVLTIAYVTEYFLLCLEVSQERCCIFQGVLDIVVSGCDEGTPANSSSMASLKTCRAHAIVWISSGVFDVGGTFLSLMASSTSATNSSIFSPSSSFPSSSKTNLTFSSIPFVISNSSEKSLTSSKDNFTDRWLRPFQ